MALNPKSVYLYAATLGDLEKAYAAADVSGVPRTNVTGNFGTAWRLVQNGGDLVISVGGAALYSLYYNPCGWTNPSGEPGGHTPFSLFPDRQGISETKPGYFVNAAGYTALDSLKLAVMLAYYAIHGTFPYQYSGMPRQEIPQHICVAGSNPNITFASQPSAPALPAGPTGTAPTTPSVGIYADFTSTQEVLHAVQMGWPGISSTGALGTPHSPYTAELPTRPDYNISQALSQLGEPIWWLSFWTVSWPSVGDTFYNAGFQAGRYSAQTLDSYQGKAKPEYVILDPEGYNVPANTHTEWADFLRGWADGMKAVNGSLNPAFYCNQYQYTTYALSQVNLPAFIAVSPIQGNRPAVKGGNIQGYIAYYANCPAKNDVAQVKNWGGAFNTVQFRDSGVDCAP